MEPIFLQKRRLRSRKLAPIWLSISFVLLAVVYCLAIVYLLTNRSLSQVAKLSYITASLPAALGFISLLHKGRR